MITSITMNYDSRDFFGQYEFKSDTYYGPIDKKLVCKVLGAVRRNSGYYAHFNRDDGSSECITRGYAKDTLRHTHFGAWNSQDAETITDLAEFRKAIYAELEQ